MNIKVARNTIDQLCNEFIVPAGYTKVKGFLGLTNIKDDFFTSGINVDVIRYRSSYAVNFHVYFAYSEVHNILGTTNPEFPYTFAKFFPMLQIDQELFNVEYLQKEFQEKLSEILKIVTEYNSLEKINSNLLSENFRDWFVSDKCAQYSIKFATLIKNNNIEKVTELIQEIEIFVAKKYSAQSRSELIKISNIMERHLTRASNGTKTVG